MEISIKTLQEYCRRTGARIQVDYHGMLWSSGGDGWMQLSEDKLAADMAARGFACGAGVEADLPQRTPRETPVGGRRLVVIGAVGYDKLADVLGRAFSQAATGKGKERHANAQPFEEQSTQKIMQLLETSDGATHQAIKKLVEARRLPADKRTAERLGAIVYIASAIIADERRQAGEVALRKPANDNCGGHTHGDAYAANHA